MTNSLWSQFDNPALVVSAVRVHPETLKCTALCAEENAIAAAAAIAVCNAAGISPILAAHADWEVEGWDIEGFPEPGPVEWFDISDVWGHAQEAARQALKARWPDLDTMYVALQLDDPEEPA